MQFHVRLKGKKALPELIFTVHTNVQQHCVVCLRLSGNYVYHQPKGLKTLFFTGSFLLFFTLRTNSDDFTSNHELVGI
jgi:hypothetical protein